jgi:hypothetical protein
MAHTLIPPSSHYLFSELAVLDNDVLLGSADAIRGILA